jgi:hypothetical protein
MMIFRKPSQLERECLFELMLAAEHHAYDIAEPMPVVRRNGVYVRSIGPIRSASRHLDCLEHGIGRSA